MAHLVPNEQFDELVALAGPVIDRAREICAGQSQLPEGTSVEENILTDEANAMSTAIMAVIRRSPLTEPAVMIALGGLVGVLMAQGTTEHADLWMLVRKQVKETYDEMIGSAKPLGGEKPN